MRTVKCINVSWRSNLDLESVNTETKGKEENSFTNTLGTSAHEALCTLPTYHTPSRICYNKQTRKTTPHNTPHTTTLQNDGGTDPCCADVLKVAHTPDQTDSLGIAVHSTCLQDVYNNALTRN